MSLRMSRTPGKSPWLAAIVLAAVFLGARFWPDQELPGGSELPRSGDGTSASSQVDNLALEAAYAQGRSDVWVTMSGTVSRVLRDDTQGSQHQRFIVELPSGLTVLVAHNIDLAPRVTDIQRGQPIEAHGEYEYNDKGGVLHWTHHDPGGRRNGGWIRYQGQTYR